VRQPTRQSLGIERSMAVSRSRHPDPPWIFMRQPLTLTRQRLIGLVTLSAAGAMLAACKSDEVCDPELVTHAQAFLEAHQACQTDADCVLVSDYCGTLPNGFCGQLVMNREGESSAEWRDLSAALKNCAATECTVCLAARGLGCKDGSCGGP